MLFCSLSGVRSTGSSSKGFRRTDSSSKGPRGLATRIESRFWTGAGFCLNFSTTSMANGPVRGKSWGGPHGRLPVAQAGLSKAAWSARSAELPFEGLSSHRLFFYGPKGLFWPGRATPHANLRPVFCSLLRSATTPSSGRRCGLAPFRRHRLCVPRQKNNFKPARRLRANPKP